MEASSFGSEETTDHSSNKFTLGKYKRFDIKNQRFPFCIVWTPLPLISWFLPIIGHTGICTSDGKVHDFAGSYYISVDNMAFGEPYKYVPLQPELMDEDLWDEGIKISDNRFKDEEHNLFCNNCHSHVAQALNSMNYNKRNNYNMIDVWWMCLTKSKYVSWGHFIKTYIGFFIILILFLLITKLR